MCPLCCICSAFTYCLRLKWRIYSRKTWHFSPCTFCVLSLSDFVSGGRFRNGCRVKENFLTLISLLNFERRSFERLWTHVTFSSMIVTYYLLQWIFTVLSDICICYVIWKMFISEINTLSYFGWKKITSAIYFIISYVYRSLQVYQRSNSQVGHRVLSDFTLKIVRQNPPRSEWESPLSDS